MPTSTWKTSEQYLTSKETFEQIRDLLDKGLYVTATEIVNEILEDMEQAKKEGR